MFRVSPARTVEFWPRKVASIWPSRRIKVSSKSCRCSGGPPPGGMCMYDEAEASGSLLAGQGNGVGIVDQPDVRQVFELSNGEAAFGIVRRQNPRSGAERWNAVRALLPTIE